MSVVYRKFFFGIDKQEAWLNSMSQAGYALIEVGFFRYEFEEKPNKKPRIYRIDPVLGIRSKKRQKNLNTKVYENASMSLVTIYYDFVYFSQPAKHDAEADKQYFVQHYANRIKHYSLWLLLCIMIGYLLSYPYTEFVLPSGDDLKIVVYTAAFIVVSAVGLFSVFNIIKALAKSSRI